MKDATKAMTVRLPIDQAEALATVASVENRPVSEVIRAAIAEHVDTRRRDPAFQRDLRTSVERAQRLLAAMEAEPDA
ncbi:ribbon-helix-helix protein, CopG family [Streptomyces sp. NPDC088847]|uniref:ribbon-helix-helix protein, CopG family n=1 Tax=Streptomyces sp. NPDC088847 TaxID=3365909 RepID=UPI00381111B2